MRSNNSGGKFERLLPDILRIWGLLTEFEERARIFTTTETHFCCLPSVGQKRVYKRGMRRCGELYCDCNRVLHLSDRYDFLHDLYSLKGNQMCKEENVFLKYFQFYRITRAKRVSFLYL